MLAARVFAQPQASSYLVAAAIPTATEEDAIAKIAESRWLEAGVADKLHARLTELTDVTPSPEAGEHARAFLASLALKDGVSQRWEVVIWAEAGQPILGAIGFSGPALLDGSKLVSRFVQRQRMRLVQEVRT